MNNADSQRLEEILGFNLEKCSKTADLVREEYQKMLMLRSRVMFLPRPLPDAVNQELHQRITTYHTAIKALTKEMANGPKIMGLTMVAQFVQDYMEYHQMALQKEFPLESVPTLFDPSDISSEDLACLMRMLAFGSLMRDASKRSN
ncbi:hypothetical protein AAP_02364 [Ascosphaera apis ARSEF 7405]|uniref:Uncharacterized protein n=1 Tax=Ascosphaera apis ARSEF 7405 TaxID=392613 RepID=A0A168A7J1_9EURO|nr:hypothetical protein AAP_02364 [Ascosphaera apis ARSEF 7405]